MNLYQLIYFSEAASRKSYTKAAEKLYVSRQAISKAVHALEQELGDVHLLEEKGRELELTKEGEAFLLHTLPAVRTYEAAERYAKEFRNAVQQTVTIALGPSVFIFIPPEWFYDFEKLYPGLKIQLVEETETNIWKGLQNGRFEAAVIGVFSRADAEPYRKTIFITDPLCVIFSSHHPLAGKEEIGIRDMIRYPVISPRKDSGLYRMMTELYYQVSAPPDIGLYARDVMTVLQTLERTDMVAVNIRSVSKIYEENNMIVRDLKENNASCQTMFLTNYGCPHDSILERLGRYLEERNQSPSNVSSR